MVVDFATSSSQLLVSRRTQLLGKIRQNWSTDPWKNPPKTARPEIKVYNWINYELIRSNYQSTNLAFTNFLNMLCLFSFFQLRNIGENKIRRFVVWSDEPIMIWSRYILWLLALKWSHSCISIFVVVIKILNTYFFFWSLLLVVTELHYKKTFDKVRV